MGVVVYTAAIGPRTDAIRPPLVIDRKAHYICFSDRPVHVHPYEWVPVPSADNPSLASRSYKVLADHPALDGYAQLLWHDASYQLLQDVEWVRFHLSHVVDLVAFRHAHKKRKLDGEARKVASYGYLDLETAQAHVKRYREAGFVRNDPVTCGGLLARRRSERMTTFNQLWWSELQLWGGRDQASLDYSAFASGIVLCHLDGRIKSNAYAQWRGYGLAVPA
jgi:hypothetical protein